MVREQRLIEVFVELADTLVEQFDVVGLLQTLTERCVDLVDTDAAGLLLDDQRGNLRLIAHTHESARLLELFELQQQEGPCLDYFATGQVIANIDLATATDRWPVFTRAAREVGFGTSHAVPLRLRQQVIGALNLFRAERRPLSDNDLAVAQGLAGIATIGLLHERASATRSCSPSSCKPPCTAGSSSSRRKASCRPRPEQAWRRPSPSCAPTPAAPDNR
ncbi:GAF domain-containing protein [Geodermatophilus obscurus]|uniref:GAF domain-containing protein n=1 Tax=Geodermatophilus obscurus TaxID=1861 RepID=A0A1M7T307_9ACTN|nr:GAF domain-containing protein [Geodermatophilus obscurus]SHN65175.1 GAF domain-containing protein [Geodermatophilus obscurus]